MGLSWYSVLFVDLDDTIIRGPFETAVFPIIFKKISEKSGLDVKEIRHLIVEENRYRQHNKRFSATLAMDWDDIVQKVASKLSVRLPHNIVLEIVKNHTSNKYIKVVDNADMILKKMKLNEPSRPIVASTKGLRKYQMPVLKALNILKIFDDIITPDKFNSLKDNVKFYGTWPKITKLQITFGDHYEDDIFYPRKFGFKTILKNREIKSKLKQDGRKSLKASLFKKYPVKPDIIIHLLNELPNAVKKIEEAYK